MGILNTPMVQLGWKVTVVFPFGYPKTLPAPNAGEDLDHRLHIDAYPVEPRPE
jgi:hypothetical protein